QLAQPVPHIRVVGVTKKSGDICSADNAVERDENMLDNFPHSRAAFHVLCERCPSSPACRAPPQTTFPPAASRSPNMQTPPGSETGRRPPPSSAPRSCPGRRRPASGEGGRSGGGFAATGLTAHRVIRASDLPDPR